MEYLTLFVAVMCAFMAGMNAALYERTSFFMNITLAVIATGILSYHIYVT